MTSENENLKKCAKELLAEALKSEGHDLIYREFCDREPRFKGVTFEAFCREFVPAKLALGCVAWVGCCAGHRIEGKELKNLYFKEVMELFESPRSLEEATRFSESLYASNADPEESPVLGVFVHLFHKLGLEAMGKKDDSSEPVLNPGFIFMMEVAEAMKIVFETKFDDFLYTHQDLRTTSGKKKADPCL